MPPHGSIINAHQLLVSYNDGAVTAVDHINVTVPGGQVLGLLGGNGAGKTSTLRTFGGIIPPTGGTLTIAGHNMSDVRQAEQARRTLGYCPDTGGLVRQATVREHLGVALGLRGELDRWPQALHLVETFGLGHVLDRETGGFSHGMSRRLSVLLAVFTAETVLILDEPFDGVDPLGVKATEDAIRTAAAAGLAVIVSTHLLPLLVRVSDRIVVMRGGKLEADGPAADFAGDAGQSRYQSILSTPRNTVPEPSTAVPHRPTIRAAG